MSARVLLAGVDGGQTSTKAIIATAAGEVIGAGTGPACDHFNVPGGVQRNRLAIRGALRSAATRAGVEVRELDAVGLGLTSFQRELDPAPPVREIVREITQPSTIWVDTDFVSNLAGASGSRPGIVVIAGGGSIGYGIDDAGREAIAGGLGYLMGDEGSGWFLGIEALQAAAKAEDRRGPDTLLLDRVRAHYAMHSIREILRVIYRADFERAEVSGLAPMVISAAREGDAIAASIVGRGVAGLVDIATGIALQLHEPGAPIAVYPTGGIFGAEDVILAPFANRLGQAWSGARIERPRFSPACGALFKAAAAHGITIDAAFLDRIDGTLPHTAS
jgi:glucosamine kinase